MIILWKSSDSTVSLTLLASEKQYSYEWEAGRTLARDMLAYLRDTLAHHDMTFADITGIGVFQGPGSYTGLRIGLTVLNTIAEASNIPIVGATGTNWQELCQYRLAQGVNDHIVMPEYGGDAHITKPRK